MKKLLSTPCPNPSSYMTCLVTGPEAFELSSKAGSPETLSPRLRVDQLYHTRLQHKSLLVSSSVSSLLAALLALRHHSSTRSHSSRRSASLLARGCCCKSSKGAIVSLPSSTKSKIRDSATSFLGLRDLARSRPLGLGI